MKNGTGAIRLSVFVSFAVACLLLVFLLASGCLPSNVSLEPDIKDGGFLSGEPCGPPCFLSIVPGATRETQAIQILTATGLYQNCFVYNHEAESGLRGIICSHVGIAFYRGADVVGSVGFDSSQSLTVGEVIAKYGKPDAITVGTMGTPEEQPNTVMALHYEGIHADVGLGQQEGVKFEITSTTPIESIGYSASGYPSENESANKLLLPWNGYGEYHEPPIP